MFFLKIAIIKLTIAIRAIRTIKIKLDFILSLTFMTYLVNPYSF